jgi:Putative zinc-finger
VTGPDAYTQWDAAYVLGALNAAQRGEFEDHLAGCASCQELVAGLAGVPGLLAQVPAGEVLAMDLPGAEAPVGPPGSLMPVLPTDAPPAVARRRWMTPLAAAAAALLIGGVGGYAVSSATRGASPGSSAFSPRVSATGAAGRLAFSAVEPSSMTAVLDLVPAASSTELRVECQYATGSGSGGGPDYQAAWAQYSIWVVDRSGKAMQVKSWTARPNLVMHPSGVAHLPVGQIAVVEIRRVDTGRTVMRAALA